MQAIVSARGSAEQTRVAANMHPTRLPTCTMKQWMHAGGSNQTKALPTSCADAHASATRSSFPARREVCVCVCVISFHSLITSSFCDAESSLNDKHMTCVRGAHKSLLILVLFVFVVVIHAQFIHHSFGGCCIPILVPPIAGSVNDVERFPDVAVGELVVTAVVSGRSKPGLRVKNRAWHESRDRDRRREKHVSTDDFGGRTC